VRIFGSQYINTTTGISLHHIFEFVDLWTDMRRLEGTRDGIAWNSPNLTYSAAATYRARFEGLIFSPLCPRRCGKSGPPPLPNANSLLGSSFQTGYGPPPVFRAEVFQIVFYVNYIKEKPRSAAHPMFKCQEFGT
jgi:hypothetical protein